MVFYSRTAMERVMKVQEVILSAMAKKITWWQSGRDHRDQRPATRGHQILPAIQLQQTNRRRINLPILRPRTSRR